MGLNRSEDRASSHSVSTPHEVHDTQLALVRHAVLHPHEGCVSKRTLRRSVLGRDAMVAVREQVREEMRLALLHDLTPEQVVEAAALAAERAIDRVGVERIW